MTDSMPDSELPDTPPGPSPTTTPITHCGFIAIVGRPNVGKSTLMNRLIGQKVSITSAKAQTTRHRIHGVLTREARQFVFVDTPGFQTKHRNALNRVMNRSVTQALADVDVIVFVIEAGKLTEADQEVIGLLPKDRPVLLLLNKTDKAGDRAKLLPFVERIAKLHGFHAILPVSAQRGDGLDALMKVAGELLPEGPAMFDADDFTDRSERFLAAEYIREKLFRQLGDELPYGLAVEIERFEAEGNLRRIAAAVIVGREAHKGIVIGRNGEVLKTVGSAARYDMEKVFDSKVFLELHVKVRSGWADDERALKSLGFEP
jgi:GTP-binding protein Era